MILLLFFLDIILLIFALGLIAASIVKKRLKLFISGALFILISVALGFFIFLEHTIESRHLDIKELSLAQCFSVVIEEIQHPYDPCQSELFDGPVYHSEKKQFRHFFYDDFVVILSPDSDVNVLPLTQFEFPEYFFSLSRAAYAIREQIIIQNPTAGNLWMIQLTDISKKDSDPLFNFVIGEGKLNLTCPHYFKITKHASVSLSGDIYQIEGEEMVRKGSVPFKEIESLTPDRNFGINRIEITNE